MSENWNILEALIQELPEPSREAMRPMAGLYMFDYLTNDAEMPPKLMESQLAVALELLHAGRAPDASGVVVGPVRQPNPSTQVVV